MVSSAAVWKAGTDTWFSYSRTGQDYQVCCHAGQVHGLKKDKGRIIYSDVPKFVCK